jgi:hypothetical protein
MQCFVIDPATKTITAQPLTEGMAQIRALIGFDSVDSDEVRNSTDRLFFDESCFLRDNPAAGRFQLDTLAPVAGIGIIVGTAQSENEFQSPSLTLEALQSRVRFLT